MSKIHHRRKIIIIKTTKLTLPKIHKYEIEISTQYTKNNNAL